MALQTRKNVQNESETSESNRWKETNEWSLSIFIVTRSDTIFVWPGEGKV